MTELAFEVCGGKPPSFPTVNTIIVVYLKLRQALCLLRGVCESLPHPSWPASQSPTYIPFLLTVFEQCQIRKGTGMFQQLSNIERNWPYCFEFDLPLAFLTAIQTSCILSGHLFSVLFPVFVLSTDEVKTAGKMCFSPLPFLSLVVFLSNRLFPLAVFLLSFLNSSASAGMFSSRHPPPATLKATTGY